MIFVVQKLTFFNYRQKQVKLDAMNPRFTIGQMGEIGKHWFKVRARVVYGNEEGDWDEWCLELHDGTLGWLEVEDGQTFLAKKQRLTSPVPPFERLCVGDTLNLNSKAFFVVEKCRATVVAVEGELPFELRPGQPMLFIDGVVEGRPASLEYGEEAIEFVMGEVIERGGIISADIM
jgi:hypothetical protein